MKYDNFIEIVYLLHVRSSQIQNTSILIEMLLMLSNQNVQTADNNKALPNSCSFEAYDKINAVSNCIGYILP
jgi:hypothetical protein